MSEFTQHAHDNPKLNVELDTQECTLSEQDLSQMRRDLAPLEEVISNFPIADLYVTVQFHPRSRDYHVKTSLLLSGQTLFTGERDFSATTAFNRCVRKLFQKVQAYKAELANEDELRKYEQGTRQAVAPSHPVDLEAVRSAVQRNDYATFREKTLAFDESVRKRAGRWIQRYPKFEAQLGDDYRLADLVEEVFLNAFERFDERRADQTLGDWLEELIDPSVKALAHNPHEEMANISFARTLRGVRPGNE